MWRENKCLTLTAHDQNILSNCEYEAWKNKLYDVHVYITQHLKESTMMHHLQLIYKMKICLSNCVYD